MLHITKGITIWDSGTTLKHVIRSINGNLQMGKPGWIIIPSSLFEALAQVLAIPSSTLLVTTYRSNLERLYDTFNPHAKQLNTAFSFHLCPNCVATERLLKRFLALPHITCCPFHQIALVKICQCGQPLQLFSPQI